MKLKNIGVWVLILIISLSGGSLGVVNAEIVIVDDSEAYVKSYETAEGEGLFNNFSLDQEGQTGIIQPICITLNTDTKITWIGTSHTKIFDVYKDEMKIIISQIDPTIKGAQKTVRSYSYKAKVYNVALGTDIIAKNSFCVATPNIVLPKGKYVIAVKSDTDYFSTLDATTQQLMEDLKEYASDFTWMGNPHTGNPSNTTGSVTIKGIPTNLPENTNPIDENNDMNLTVLAKEIKTIKDEAFQAYINSDAYKRDWALVEEELVRAQAYNVWLAEQQRLQKIKEANRPIKLIVNNYTVQSSAAPVIKDGRLLVPVRALTEALDCSVAYDSKTKKIRIADNVTGELLLEMVINRRMATVLTPSGWYDDRNMDVAPIIINGSTMVPVRFVAEAMNFTVEWSESTRTVKVTSGGEG